ncbi:hypothetical protein XENOCAPTIV_021728 [Xenoophorus captivus]|uniref:Uncharacterized protein n=1 Tax=Xenoophorus captivus TaxID=1517983 RepID=A0ABV0Q6L1_9TELE
MRLTTHLPFSSNIHANQETKDNISCTPPPALASDASFPACGKSNHTSGEMKCSRQGKKRDKIEAYPPLGTSFVSYFFCNILDFVLSSCGRRERGRVLPGAVPTSITHLFTCG